MLPCSMDRDFFRVSFSKGQQPNSTVSARLSHSTSRTPPCLSPWESPFLFTRTFPYLRRSVVHSFVVDHPLPLRVAAGNFPGRGAMIDSGTRCVNVSVPSSERLSPPHALPLPPPLPPLPPSPPPPRWTPLVTAVTTSNRHQRPPPPSATLPPTTTDIRQSATTSRPPERTVLYRRSTGTVLRTKNENVILIILVCAIPYIP